MAVLLGVVLTGAAARADDNVLRNGSFTDVKGDAPAGWVRSSWNGQGELAPDASGHGDAHAVKIESVAGADVAWSCTVPVEIGARYRLRGWVRTEGVELKAGARGALLNVHGIDGAATPAVRGTKDWTLVEVEFEAGMRDEVMVNCLLGGWGLATGKAWYDDVSLELVRRGTVAEPRVRVDGADVREAISPYIYGQFIEHLGKCIYGGIWAEVLEDRKFYEPVGSAASAWKAVGEPSRVAMTTEKPLAGAHSVRVSLAGGTPGGIVQDGLTLRGEVGYAGSVWLRGSPSAAPVTVRLVWGEGPADRNEVRVERLGGEFEKSVLRFDGPRGVSGARLEIVSPGTGSFDVGAASLMPRDNVEGFRADTLALLKELDAPVYRWPGGNFVSGYDWHDGVGERDRRPPRKNPAWLGIEHNDVGVHEFMRLCDLLHTEAYLAVNTGLGSVQDAADLVEYVNGGPETPMGKLRAQRGRAEAWGVRWWGVGNEMYGSWQLGNVPLAEYVKRHSAFAKAMRAKDASIKLVGVGAAGEWSRTMLQECAEDMDYISEHVYWQERPGVLAHVSQAPESLRGIAAAHRGYRRDLRSLRGNDIRIVQDEWNYWYGPHVFGELGTRYFMKDALGCAAALNEFARNSDLFFMANYAQTVNVIGAIKATPTAAAMETTGLVLTLYRRHLGTIPCATETEGLIDAVAAWSEDRGTLTLAVVNPTRAAADVALEVRGATLTGEGTRWEIASDDPMAFNDPDGAKPVGIVEEKVAGVKDRVKVRGYSVTLFRFAAKGS
jgi:alpha-N-arabinofuranosidase